MIDCTKFSIRFTRAVASMASGVQSSTAADTVPQRYARLAHFSLRQDSKLWGVLLRTAPPSDIPRAL